jgi:imidazolonepropionase
VFTIDETRRILTAARDAGLALKLHADELEPSGGAELAAELGATSADHLAAISRQGVEALARAETVATLLPGTMLFLGRDRQAPARRLIDAGAAVALATDFNPGTSPTVNLPLVLTLAVSQLRMSAAEALVAATANGAAALGLAGELGQIAPGFSADLALFEGDDVREIPYWYGDRRCRGSWVRGKACHPLELRVS